MPLYQYECQSCGQQVEDLRRYDERDEPAECPSCGERAHRVLAGFAIGGSSSPKSQAPASACSIGGG
jgi:putative FmdB family regulatory protein